MDLLFGLQIGNVVSYLFLLGMRLFGTFIHFDKNVPSHVRSKYPVRFLPAEWSFTIWFLILALLGGFAIFQAFPQNRREEGFVQRIGVLFIINAIANGLWVLAFGYEWIPLTTLFMVIILVSLLIIYIRLWGEKQTLATSWEAREIVSRFWLVEVPFSMYLGWITIETVINVAVQFYDDPFKWRENADIFALALMTIVFGLALVILWFYHDVAYALVIVWGLAGLAHRQRNYQTIFVLSIILAVFILVACCFAVIRKIRENVNPISIPNPEL
jgi:benzodiazapine receptor